MVARSQHQPVIGQPWFAAEDEGMSLHRYLDDSFVQQFTHQAINGNLQPSRQQAWWQADRFGGHKDDLPTLRLPMHQAFYVTCCEINCDTFGLPAFDPARIESAGFVVRRGSPGHSAEQWYLSDGQPHGWMKSDNPALEPNERRRLLQQKLIQPQFPEPPYSGEESYPLHKLLVKTRQGDHARSRSLLWGYVPLGGQYQTDASGEFDFAEARSALSKELSWPFGSYSAHSWRKEDSRPVYHGKANQAVYELLRHLIFRYQAFENNDDKNIALRNLLLQIHFYPYLRPDPENPLHFDPYAAPKAEDAGQSLRHWLENNVDAIQDWLNDIQRGDKTLTAHGLPDVDSQDLYLNRAQATTLRDLLLQCGTRAMQLAEADLTLPRFNQEAEDRYFLQPFARWQDDCGCERIQWGKPSLAFRVAAPLDPEAQRPRTIIMPKLSDLKRGKGRGVILVLPKSLADALLKINPDLDIKEGGDGNRAEICWHFSLSIPVVTICAMILLMILINLLNLFLRWLPWAFQLIPKRCR